MSSKRFVLLGGAGFIGSHFADRLLADPSTEHVVIYDNFTSGQQWHYAHHAGDSRLSVMRADIHDRARLTQALLGADWVIHLAANPDIARAATEPDIDFTQGTALTNHVVEAMRAAGVSRILYASGSGVYGDLGHAVAHEDACPLHPVSPYGASKLASEVLICAYAHMFGWKSCAFRFGNVVGGRQTHGVGYDFVRRLRTDPTRLPILGNGRQEKSYVWVGDVVDGVLLAGAAAAQPFAVYNIATGDSLTVTEIAEVVVATMGLPRGSVRYEYTGGERGWPGDVPIVRLSSERLRNLGWAPSRGSRQAIADATQAMLAELSAAGRP